MNILFLDDDYSRWKKFFNQNKKTGDILHHVTNVDDFKIAYSTGVWNEVHLDHDLYGIPDVREEDTGMECVNYIIEHSTYKSNVKYIVHSYNSERAVEMVIRLKLAGFDAKYAPFDRPEDRDRDKLIDMMVEFRKNHNDDNTKLLITIPENFLL
jgi:hypothetical protein